MLFNLICFKWLSTLQADTKRKQRTEYDRRETGRVEADTPFPAYTEMVSSEGEIYRRKGI